jgi:hypothetical protein
MTSKIAVRMLAVAVTAGWMATCATSVVAAQKPPRATVYYDQYEPSQRQRLRRESCARDEDVVGAFCAKRCEKGYIHVVGSKPYRCRSLEPLPPGHLPGAMRRQVSPPAAPSAPREPASKTDQKA